MKSILVLVVFVLFVPLFGENGFLYHGSLTDNITCLEPRSRYTPGLEESSPAGVYATDLPAFAAAHSFPWSTDEGVDLYMDDEAVVLIVPSTVWDRMEVELYLYMVDGNTFERVEADATGHTYRSIVPVPCLEKVTFPNVKAAVEHYGGKVFLKNE